MHEWFFQSYLLCFKSNTMELRNEVINADSADSTSDESITEPLDNSLEDNRLTFENNKASSIDYKENDYDTIFTEFLLELREKSNITSAATCFLAKKINHLQQLK